MPSGLENLDANRFILRYEHPFAGIASDALPQDIAPSQLVSCEGLFLRNGRLCSTTLFPFNQSYYRHTGFGSTNLYWSGVPEIMAVYTTNGRLYAIDRACNAYEYDPNNYVWDKVASPVDINGQPYSGAFYSCSQMVKGVIYIFDFFDHTEFVFTPPASMQQAQQGGPPIAGNPVGGPQDFVGGKFVMSLDQYLITCYTNMPSDGTQAIKPNRYNWSAGSALTTFGPLAGDPIVDPNAPSSLGLQTGYNTLTDVQQVITGCFAMGNVGYILHDQGITQLTPTGIFGGGGDNPSLYPFDATLLFGGKDGVGCSMPDTLAIYGFIAVWGNNNNFYVFASGAAPQEICGAAKSAIYKDINQFGPTFNGFINLYGQLCNTGVNNQEPELVYNLYILYALDRFSTQLQVIVWSYVLKTQSWTRTYVDLTQIMRTVTGNQSYAKSLTGINSPVTAQNLKFPANYTVNMNMYYPQQLYGGLILNVYDPNNPNLSTQDSFWLFQHIDQDGFMQFIDAPITTNLTFRSEEFQIYRKPTIRGVIIRARGVGTLHIKVGNTSFKDITVDTTSGIFRSFGMHTDIAPQINITSADFNGYISKVHAFGTYAEGEPL